MAHMPKQQNFFFAEIYEFFVVQRTFNARNFGSISAFLYVYNCNEKHDPLANANISV